MWWCPSGAAINRWYAAAAATAMTRIMRTVVGEIRYMLFFLLPEFGEFLPKFLNFFFAGIF